MINVYALNPFSFASRFVQPLNTDDIYVIPFIVCYYVC